MVELWGLPNDPTYAAKMEAKRQLAARHGLPLLELTDAELLKLPEVFLDWLPTGKTETTNRTAGSWSPSLPNQDAPPKPRNTPKGDNRGRNDFNAAARRERVERAQDALQLQRAGMSRAEIAKALGISTELVKELLRDGRFYADPNTNAARLQAAEAATDARAAGLTRAQFQTLLDLSPGKAKEAWRDSDVLDEAT